MPLSLPLALDAMGGDHAPYSVLEGARQALVRHPSLTYIIFGNLMRLEPLLAQMPALAQRCEVVHTDVAVAMHDKPSVAVRQGRQSSMRLAIDAVKDGKACGVVSAGNTGALMAMGTLSLRTLPGIKRPAIVSLFPTLQGESVILDLGANVVSDANDLFRFAIMGDAFARARLSLTKPRVGLLNVGSEDEKGHEEIRIAAQMLREHGKNINFHGFVEGSDIPLGVVDVVVTDGFTGNVALKTAEGTARLIRSYVKEAFQSSWLTKCAALLAKGALMLVREKLDDRKRNGALFVGLNGVVVKSHGGADAYSFCNAISMAVRLIEGQINKKIIEQLSQNNSASAATDGEMAASIIAEEIYPDAEFRGRPN